MYDYEIPGIKSVEKIELPDIAGIGDILDAGLYHFDKRLLVYKVRCMKSAQIEFGLRVKRKPNIKCQAG